jgi:hypothetical protein
MSTNELLQTLIMTLVFPCLIYAAAPGARAGFHHRASVHHYTADDKKLSKTPEEPTRFEKFVVKTTKTTTPAQADEVDSKDEEALGATSTSDNAPNFGKAILNIPVEPLFSSSSRQLSLIDKTYLDAFAILQERNACSQFYGGPRLATSVLNYLHPRLKETSLAENGIGIIMLGPITSGTDVQTGLTYRLFKQALVNLRGPFYQSVNYRSRNFFHKVGYYFANTREARVSMLLHELGHLLPDTNGRWLLLDDGGNEVQIAANTATIMDKCSEQIKGLSLQRAAATRP